MEERIEEILRQYYQEAAFGAVQAILTAVAENQEPIIVIDYEKLSTMVAEKILNTPVAQLGKEEYMSKLPEHIEVWCCPNKHDKRVELYLDGGRDENGLGWVYKRTSNGDEYTPVLPEATMLEWLADKDNPAIPEVLS